MGVHVFPILNPPSHLPPHPIPLGHPSAPAPSTLYHALNLGPLHCRQILYQLSQWGSHRLTSRKNFNLEMELPYDTAVPLPGMHTKETRIERHVYPSVHRSSVYNSQDMEAA